MKKNPCKIKLGQKMNINNCQMSKIGVKSISKLFIVIDPNLSGEKNKLCGLNKMKTSASWNLKKGKSISLISWRFTVKHSHKTGSTKVIQ